jgi:hypothetical protein
MITFRDRKGYKYLSIDGQEQTIFECACCHLPTIAEPFGYEICSVCRWEDDESWEAGGANGSYSLLAAQANFQQYRTMYALGEQRTSPKREHFLGTCISLLQDFKDQEDLRNRGILFAAYLIESEWL